MRIRFSQLYTATVILALLFLGLTAGIGVAHYKVFPFYLYRNAYVGVKALYYTHIASLFEEAGSNPFLYAPTRLSGSGVTIHDAAAVYDGLTLYTSAHIQKAFLITMEGRVVHEWGLPFSAVWERPEHIPHPVPDELVVWRKLHLFPNGDLLVLYEAPGRFPYGYGLVKIDKDSELLWTYSEMAHHDLDVGKDGTIYTLIHVLRDQPVPGVEYLDVPTVIDDAIVVLSADGEELERVSVVDALYDSQFRRMLRWVRELDDGDIIHTNSIALVTEEIAEAHPYTRPGQLLVSLKHTHGLTIVDPEQGVVTWATLGPWRLQHDADFLQNGNLLLFDNVGHLSRGGASRLLEFDPRSLEIAWDYGTNAEQALYSEQRAGQQRLPNGNTLIIETDGGRMLEVTPDRRIAWEFVNPERSSDRIATILTATRVDSTALVFLSDQSE